VSNQTQAELETNCPTLDLSAPTLTPQTQIKSNKIANNKTIDNTKPAPKGPNVHNFDVKISNQLNEIPVY